MLEQILHLFAKELNVVHVNNFLVFFFLTNWRALQQFGGCIRLLSLTALWAWSITWWHFSCCICPFSSTSTCSPYWYSIRDCLCTWCLATTPATTVFEDATFPPCIAAFSGIDFCSYFYLYYLKDWKSQEDFSKYFVGCNRIFSKRSHPSVDLVLCGNCPPCSSRGACIRSCCT